MDDENYQEASEQWWPVRAGGTLAVFVLGVAAGAALLDVAVYYFVDGLLPRVFVGRDPTGALLCVAMAAALAAAAASCVAIVAERVIYGGWHEEAPHAAALCLCGVTLMFSLLVTGLVYRPRLCAAVPAKLGIGLAERQLEGMTVPGLGGDELARSHRRAAGEFEDDEADADGRLASGKGSKSVVAI